jgi:CRP-like cAMP-binding protein
MVRRGVLIRQRVDPQGRASAVDALGPGCVLPLGLPGHSTSIPSGYAATRLLVCLCPQEVFERSLARDERTARDLIRLQQQTIERLERITDARSRSNVESRVAALICALADTLSPHRSRSRIPSELQQRDMAALIGVRHETVCRVLGTLESRGALERSAEGLRILDRDQLEAC